MLGLGTHMLLVQWVQWMDMPESPIESFDFVQIFAGCQAATRAMFRKVENRL